MMLNLGDRDYDCYEPDQHEYLKYKIVYAFYGPPQEAQQENTSTATSSSTSLGMHS